MLSLPPEGRGYSTHLYVQDGHQSVQTHICLPVKVSPAGSDRRSSSVMEDLDRCIMGNTAPLNGPSLKHSAESVRFIKGV